MALDSFFQTSLGLSGPIVSSVPATAGKATAAGAGFSSFFGPLVAGASFGLDLLGQYDKYQAAKDSLASQRRFAEALSGFEPDLIDVPELPSVDLEAAVAQSTASLLAGIEPATQAAAGFNDFVRSELEKSVPGISRIFATAAARSDELLSTELTSLDAGPSDLRRRIVAEVTAAKQPAGGAPFNDLFVTSLVDSTLQENLARRADERATVALGQNLGGFALGGARTLSPFSGTEFLGYTSITSGQAIDIAFRENMARFSAALNAEIANSQFQTELGLDRLQADSAASAKVRKPTAVKGAEAASGFLLGPVAGTTKFIKDLF